MLIFGLVFGAVLGFFFVAGPLVTAIAPTLGVAAVLPLIGAIVQLPFTISVIVALLIHFLFTLIAYVIAALATPVPASGPVAVAPPGGPLAPWELFEHFARGWLLGMNAVVTLTLPLALPWLFQWLPPVMLVLIVAMPLLTTAAIVLCIVNILPAFVPAIAANNVYAGIAGWGAWLAPGAWPATLLGLVVFAINSLSALFGATVRWVPELWTGSLMVHGGILYPFWSTPVGYNLGNFYFLDPRFGVNTPEFIPPSATVGVGGFIVMTADGATLHETGHTLNVASFGGWFNYVGWAHQNFFPAALNGSTSAYAEILAEAHLRDSTVPWFPFWAPPLVLAGLTSNTPPSYGVVTADGEPDGAFLLRAAGSTLALSGPSSDADAYPAAMLIPGAAATGVRWVLTTQPAGANAAITTPTASAATALLPRGGDYVLSFAVTDGAQLPTVGLLTWTINVVEAVITAPAQAQVGDIVTLDATASTAGTGLDGVTPLALSFVWSVAPATAVISNPTLVSPTITINEAVEHIVTLQVTENSLIPVSHSATHTISVS